MELCGGAALVDSLLVLCSVSWSLWSFLAAGWAQHLPSALPGLRGEMGECLLGRSVCHNVLCTGRAKKHVSNCTGRAKMAKSWSFLLQVKKCVLSSNGVTT